MNKACFLDRDGTINYDFGYVATKEKFCFIPGAIEGMKQLYINGYKLIIVTNQSGVARGYFSEESLKDLNNWMIEQLKIYGVTIVKTYYCPHHIHGVVDKYAIECDCRKPKLGLFYKAIEEYNIDLQHSFVIGDKLQDLSLAQKNVCSGILIGKTENDSVISSVKKNMIKNISYCDDLLTCSRFILNNKY